MRSMQCNKASGPDGLPIEFYKAFFETNVDPTVDSKIDPGDPGNPGMDPRYPGEPGIDPQK